MLADISAIIESVACIEVEQEKFIEVGCYLYRVSPAVMEMQFTENTPKNAKEILQSLSQDVIMAKDLVGECHKKNQPVSDTELRRIISQLEGVVKDIGECLCLIPSATFGGEKYAETAIRSLSDEMQNVNFEAKQPQVLLQMPKMPIESDLYSVNMEISVSTESSQALSMPPRLVDFLNIRSQRSQWLHENMKKSLTTLPQMARYIEPLYDTFFCPITKQIMDDPVTIESGVTYERKAITEWFEMFIHVEDTICPTTGMKLTSRVLSTNVALKTTIQEWQDRNEAARIKVARTALSLASSDAMVLEAIRDLQHIWRFAPFFSYFVQEMIGNIMDISTLIEFLSSSHQPFRHASLLLLLELSKSQALDEKLGSATGAILMLIRIKYNRHVDSLASEKADEILKNLERYPYNVKRMAEFGFLEPLLNHLTEGNS